jgi:hypothetical protein
VFSAGKDENLNIVKPEFVTGGESLAELLTHGTCPIEKLVLHWNMIRLDGAIALCNAILTNRFLTDLDLSYNAIGSAGAEILGKSLLENSMLVKLNIAHNNIDAVGCFTLCVGLGENKTVREFNLDGNPIGSHGCMILTKTVLASSPDLSITAQRCDLLIKHDNVKFDITGKRNNPFFLVHRAMVALSIHFHDLFSELRNDQTARTATCLTWPSPTSARS